MTGVATAHPKAKGGKALTAAFHRRLITALRAFALALLLLLKLLQLLLNLPLPKVLMKAPQLMLRPLMTRGFGSMNEDLQG
jgi:hypothetical protein